MVNSLPPMHNTQHRAVTAPTVNANTSVAKYETVCFPLKPPTFCIVLMIPTMFTGQLGTMLILQGKFHSSRQLTDMAISGCGSFIAVNSLSQRC